MVNVDEVMKFFDTAEDWEKAETNVAGVFIVKIPGTKTRPKGRMMIEINPINSETGKPTKRKGLFIAGTEMYLQFREALEEDKLYELASILDEVNKTSESKSKSKKINL